MLTLSTALAISLTGCMQTRSPAAGLSDLSQPAFTGASGAQAGDNSVAEPDPEPELEPKRLPSVGPKTLRKIPTDSDQVLLVTGEGKNSSTSKAAFYQRTDGGWKAQSAVWKARNGHKGWAANHRLGDLRSPIGVFSISDAGGRLADVGSKLPYYRSASFSISGIGIAGEPLDGAFDYVIAIDYNRRIGKSPIDKVRPEGEAKGGGIWLHIDPGGPTQGCVSLSKGHMRSLLKTLDPAKKPVVVMGDAASLGR